MRKYKHVFFDLDGTISDSAQGIMNSLRRVLDDYEFDYSGINLQKYLGPPLAATFGELLGDDRTSAAIKRYREYYTEKGAFENKLYDGITEMLTQLRAKGYVLSIATSKLETAAETILNYFHILKYFTHVTGSLPDNTRQDKDEVIACAMERAGCDRNDILMVGDRRYDLDSAEKLGIDAVGVLYGYGSYEELSACKSIFLAKQPEDIVQLLVKMEDE